MTISLSSPSLIDCSIIAPFRNQSCIQKYNASTVLITESDNLAALYDLKKNIWIKSWTFTTLSPLTCPMMYDSHSDCFVAVRKYQTIRVFKLEQEIDEGETILLPSKFKINCLLLEKSQIYALTSAGEIYQLEQLVLFAKSYAEDESATIQPAFSLNLGEVSVEQVLHVPPSKSPIPRICLLVKSKEQKFFVKIIDLHSSGTIVQQISLPNNFHDVVWLQNQLVMVSKSLQVYALTAEERHELLFDMSSIDTSLQVKHLKFISLSKDLSVVVVVSEDKNGLHQLFAYDHQFRSETDKFNLGDVPSTLTSCIQMIDSKLFLVCKSSVHFVQITAKKSNLVDSINQALQQSQLLLNADNSEDQVDPNELIQTLSRSVKPQELERFLVQSLNFLLNFSTCKKEFDLSSVRRSNLQELIFSKTFTRQFLVAELRSQRYSKEQLAKVLGLLNSELISIGSSAYMTAILDWICSLFDAYFLAFHSFDSSLLTLLRDTQLCLRRTIVSCQNCKQLDQLIQTTVVLLPSEKTRKSRIGLPNKNHLGYSLEEICL